MQFPEYPAELLAWAKRMRMRNEEEAQFPEELLRAASKRNEVELLAWAKRMRMRNEEEAQFPEELLRVAPRPST